MSHYSSGSSGPPWPVCSRFYLLVGNLKPVQNIYNDNDNYNYIYGNGNMISNQNYVLNYLVRPEALPDAIAIITKGEQLLPSSLFRAKLTPSSSGAASPS